MTKYSYDDLVKETGFLTPVGTNLVDEKFLPLIQELLSGMKTENEMRVFASILSSIIGKETANQVQQFIGQPNTKETQEEIKKTLMNGPPDPFETVWPLDIK